MQQTLAERVAFTPCPNEYCQGGKALYQSQVYARYKHTEECPDCKGSGLRYPDLSVKCGHDWEGGGILAAATGKGGLEECILCHGKCRIARSPSDPATLFYVMEAIRSRWPEVKLVFDYLDDYCSGATLTVERIPLYNGSLGIRLEPGKLTEALLEILAQMEER